MYGDNDTWSTGTLSLHIQGWCLRESEMWCLSWWWWRKKNWGDRCLWEWESLLVWCECWNSCWWENFQLLLWRGLIWTWIEVLLSCVCKRVRRTEEIVDSQHGGLIEGLFVWCFRWWWSSNEHIVKLIWELFRYTKCFTCEYQGLCQLFFLTYHDYHQELVKTTYKET